MLNTRSREIDGPPRSWPSEMALGDGPLHQLKSHLGQLALKLEPAQGLEGIKNRATWVLDKTEVITLMPLVFTCFLLNPQPLISFW